MGSATPTRIGRAMKIGWTARSVLTSIGLPARTCSSSRPVHGLSSQNASFSRTPFLNPAEDDMPHQHELRRQGDGSSVRQYAAASSPSLGSNLYGPGTRSKS